MNPELFTHCKTQIRKKSKRVYRKSLKAIVISKKNVIASTNTTIHYAKEIRLQAKVFSFREHDRFRKPTNYDY